MGKGQGSERTCVTRNIDVAIFGKYIYLPSQRNLENKL
jgi:hypothetical protein